MTQPKIDHLEAVQSYSIVPGTIDGVPVYGFTVKPGDVQWWDKGEGNRGSNGQFNERAEIAYAPAPDNQKVNSPYNVREGMTQTYDKDYWFKQGFPPHISANHEWAVLTQFHVQPGHSGIPGFGGVTFHDGAITFDSPNGDGSVFVRIPVKADMTKISLRMAVKWAANDTGYAKIVDRATGKLLGRYDGPTIAKGEWKSLKEGYYRAGGLPEGTVYQTRIDITDGDLTETAPTPAPTPDPSVPSVNPQAGAALLIAIRDGLQAQVKAIDAELDKGPYKPGG